MHTILLKKDLPQTQRAFCDGELAMITDRFGGILEVSLIDLYHTVERDYPDTAPLRIFSRTSGRNLYGSAIRVVTEHADGQNIWQSTSEPEVYPWGIIGKHSEGSFGILLDHRSILFRCTAEKTGKRVIHLGISTSHLYHGTLPTSKNQLSGNGCKLLCEKTGRVYDPAWPFLNDGNVEMEWDRPVFLKQENALLFQCKVQYGYTAKTMYLAVSSAYPVQFEEKANQCVLSAEWDGNGEFTFAASVGFRLKEVLDKAGRGGGDFTELLQRKKQAVEMLERHAPSVTIEGLPLAEDFMRLVPSYLDSCLLKDMPAIRAAQFKYGVFYFWDSIYPLRDLLWMGEYEKVKNLFRYLLDYPYMEIAPWQVSQLLLELDEILAFDNDRIFLKRIWKRLTEYFESLQKLINPENGFILTAMNAGVDDPAQLGLGGLYHSPCICGWWYGGLRVLENLALELDDQSVAGKIRELLPKIEANFLPAFFSAREGFLKSGINMDGSCKLEIFQNTSTLGMDYVFGTYLMRQVIPELADYFVRRLSCPGGFVAVAWDSEVPCNMWKAVHMNQHLGHETKLARSGGRIREAYRVMENYLDIFDHEKTAVETTNYSGCLGNESQLSDWQVFSATAACEAIRSGLAGILRHRGGFLYVPADDRHNIQLDNLFSGSTRIRIEITGQGNYFLPMEINGEPIAGTAQIPADRIHGEKVLWKIRRSDTPFSIPVLLNSYGLPVTEFSSGCDGLAFTAGADGHYPLEFYSAVPLTIRLNRESVKVEFNMERQKSWADLYFHKGDRLEVQLKK